MAKLNRKDQENILNYGDQIKHIASFVDAVRKTVGQYLGSRGNKGHINMIREVLQNALDEMQKENSPCHEVWVDYNEITLELTVIDTGRGIPFGRIIEIFTSQHTSSNYIKKDREFSSGRHGVGAKVTNACSETFRVESYLFNGEARAVQFVDGHPWKEGEVSIPNPSNFQGTKVSFTPDIEVMGEVTTTGKDVANLTHTLLMLTTPGIGNTVHFSYTDKTGAKYNQDMINDDGILSFLIAYTENPLIAPILISDITHNMKCDIAFTYDSTDLGGDEVITSFANMCPTVNNESTHVKGFIDTLCNYFRNYMNKIFLNNSKTKCISTDIRKGLRAVVTVSHIEPDFSGQAKEIFTNKDIIPYLQSVMENALNEWVKCNSGDLAKLCRFLKGNADLRLSEEANKQDFVKKIKKKSTLTNLPSKYVPPEGDPRKEDWELIIVEGDSAMGPAVSGRCARRQGIFPIRGKIINAITNAKDTVMKNEEVCNLAVILGGGIGNNFDIEKCPYKKIIFMTDADPDGLQIRQLLMKLFIMYFRPLISEGRIYIAVPPLYGLRSKKDTTFFVDREDYMKYLQNNFSKSYTVSLDNKKAIVKNELLKILYNNRDYIDSLESISMNYAIHPQMLEFIIRYRNKSVEWMKKFIKSIWRFVTVNEKRGVIILDGLIGEQYYTAVVNQQLQMACTPLISYIDKSYEWYYINGEKHTLYDLMKLFNQFRPKGITRYKGLGEMGPKELKISTLHPDGNRTLLQLTVDNIKKQIQEIRELQSDLSVLLRDVDISQFEVND